jgi:hypothetical protein
VVGFALLALGANSGALSAAPGGKPPEARAPLSHEAYVWQRAWSEPVCDAVKQHAGQFAGLTVLNAEVSWKEQQPQVVRVALDYPTLTNARCPVGLALRIGAYRGPFSTNDATAEFIAGLAVSIIAEAKANGLVPRELQIDFDCAESKLAGYVLWVQTLRRKAAPVPVSVTVLPSWMANPAFPRLVATSGSYVLQVHSIERPRGLETPLTLCDPAAARRAVERAARLQIPFRVALPTYG